MNTSLTPGSVLVGVDGSAGSLVALTWAARHAEAQDRPLVVVHVATPPQVTDFGFDLVRAQEDLLRAGHRVADRGLQLVRSAHPAVPVSVQVALGDPRVVLAELAEAASVLVLGSRGLGPVASLMLGSVSVSLSAHAPCPVVVARPRPAAVAALDLCVVVGVDGGPDSEDALTFAFETASSQYRRLIAVYAVGDIWGLPYPDVASAELVQSAAEIPEQLLDEALAPFLEKFPDVLVERRVVRQAPVQALVAASQTASVVVVGCRGRSGAASRVLGSVSRAVVERAYSTVVVMRRRHP
jgi:nucleotide-binding universal stress UspA family protein